MKRLILKNHLDQKLAEFDVFVDGQDFTHKFPKPEAFWLGTIMLVEKELEPEPVVALELSPALEFTEEEKSEIDETHAYEEAKQAHESQIQAEEALNEPEETGNQSIGELRVGETSEPESVKDVPEKSARGKSGKGSKKPRKS